MSDVTATVTAPNPAATLPEAQASPPAEVPTPASTQPSATPSKRLKLSDKRRDNSNLDAERWERARQKAEAKEKAGAVPSDPPADSAPAKDPATGKFLPRKTRAAAAESAKDGAVQNADTSAEPADVSSQTPAADPAAKRKQLEALATELGFKIDAKTVTAADRYSLREEARRRQAAYDEKVKADRDAFEKERGAFSEKSKRVEAFEAALEAGDFDGMAAAIGRKEWNTLQEEALENISNPSNREIKRLRAEIEAEKKERAEAAEKEKTAAEQRRQAELVHGAKVAIAHEASKSTDRVLSAVYWDPELVDGLYDVQARYYDHVTQTTIPLEEALDVDLGGGKTIRAYLQRKYESLHKAFGPQAAPLPPPRPVVTPAAAPAAPKPRPAPAPRVEAPERKLSISERIRARRERDDEVIRRFAAPLES